MSVRAANGRVVIAGGGPAASAAAFRLCSLGLKPVLLVTSARTPPGVEAISESAFPLLLEFGLESAARQAGAVVREGLGSAWGNERVLRRGHWMYVDRAAFAHAMLTLAREGGAQVEKCASLPPLRSARNGVTVELAGREEFFDAAIDATGRSAVWSRPVSRWGRAVADIFMAPAAGNAAPMVAELDSDSWYYAMAAGNQRTVGLIHERRSASETHSSALLGHLGPLRWLARRPEFPQWTHAPVRERRVSVGDALLAHSPVAGNGIHFALLTAKLAAELAHSWIANAKESARAAAFYCELARSSRVRHVNALQRSHQEQPQPDLRSAIGGYVRFAGPTRCEPLHVGEGFKEGEAIVLPDGTSVRWLAGVDLLELRAIASRPVPASSVVNYFSATGLSTSRARALMDWCMKHELLSTTLDG